MNILLIGGASGLGKTLRIFHVLRGDHVMETTRQSEVDLPSQSQALRGPFGFFARSLEFQLLRCGTGATLNQRHGSSL